MNLQQTVSIIVKKEVSEDYTINFEDSIWVINIVPKYL
jgi:hypothetical protein